MRDYGFFAPYYAAAKGIMTSFTPLKQPAAGAKKLLTSFKPLKQPAAGAEKIWVLFVDL